ncbi:MAG: GMC family oxidoreductase [Solirubrobacterales bacterium]|nr:GMC family oxidoreductase [Solirubrobacterales bacterium]
MADSFDAVVVGSGFGGGITACRLAQAGWRVCVLERGRRFGRGDFISEPEQAPTLLWHHTLNPGGIFDLRLFKDIVVLTAAGVGGGSLVYANVQLRAPAGVFDAGWPAGITRDALDPYYDRVESVLEPVPTPAEPRLAKMRAFRDMARAAGEQDSVLPIAVYFGEDDRVNPFGGAPQSGCINLGRCNIGCPQHAKNTIDLNYLARAEREGAEVRAHCEVLRLDPPDLSGGRWRVGYRGLADARDGEVEAPVVVLCAGTLGSTRLLLQNRRRLSHLSPALGTHFSGNGDALAAAFNPAREGVKDARTDYGPVMTSRIDYWDRHRFMVADGALPPRFVGLLKVLRGEAALVGWRKHLLLRLKYLAVRLGMSDRVVTPKTVKLDLQTDPIEDSLVFLMLGQDAADGRMRLTPIFRQLDIEWSTARSMPLFDAMKRTATELGRVAEAEPFFALGAGPFGKDITVHPLGGCPMSDDPALGVVDSRGRVHGHAGLLVLDGSIVPTALGVNPSETIAALAERNVEELVNAGGPSNG